LETKVFDLETKVFELETKVFAPETKVFAPETKVFDPETKVFAPETIVFDSDTLVSALFSTAFWLPAGATVSFASKYVISTNAGEFSCFAPNYRDKERTYLYNMSPKPQQF
jgi:hypothetical protein